MKNAADFRPAILIFGRTVKEEAKAKKFIGNGKNSKSRSIAHQLIHHSLKIVKETQVPHFFIHSKKQQGDSFALRLQNAYQEIFKQGYTHVIAVGTDCPNLSSCILLKSIKSLKSNNCVLGPDKKGGCYLIGFSKNAFESLLFQNLKWETGQFLQSLKLELSLNNFSSEILQTLTDINSANDIRALLIQNIQNWFSLFFLGIWSVIQNFFIYNSPLKRDINKISLHLFRGPPNLA